MIRQDQVGQCARLVEEAAEARDERDLLECLLHLPRGRRRQDRIRAVETRLRQDHSEPSSVHNLFTFARFSGKGGIDLRGVTPPAVLSNEDSLRIAQHLSFPDNLDAARTQWRQLLDARSELSPIGEESSVPGMLVFALKGNAAEAKQVADALNSYRRELTGRYFNAGLLAPTMVVLANLARPDSGTAATASAGEVRGPGQFANAAPPRPTEQRSPAQRPTEQRSPEQRGPEQRSPAGETVDGDQRPGRGPRFGRQSKIAGFRPHL